MQARIGKSRGRQETPNVEDFIGNKEEVILAHSPFSLSTTSAHVSTQRNPCSSPTLEESSAKPMILCRSTRIRKQNPRYTNTSCQFTIAVSNSMYYKDAANKEEWQQAMIEEIKAIERNRTWEMTDLSKGTTAIRLKWMFKTKYYAHGSIQKHKACLMAKGYAQQYGIDFEDTFSPVACFETVRLVLSLTTQLQWLVYQFDVKSVFLQWKLEEEVYVAQLEGFIKEDYETKAYRLKNALYGLKQAPRTWYSSIHMYFQHERVYEK